MPRNDDSTFIGFLLGLGAAAGVAGYFALKKVREDSDNLYQMSFDLEDATATHNRNLDFLMDHYRETVGDTPWDDPDGDEEIPEDESVSENETDIDTTPKQPIPFRKKSA
jgi:hypothetical protein